MSFLKLLFGAEARQGDYHPSADPPRWILGGGATSKAGVNVTLSSAEAVSAVFACVRVLSFGVAQLPLQLFRELDRGREKLSGSRLYTLVHTQPNPFTTSFDWRERMMRHLLLRGNSYDQIIRNQAGEVVEFLQLDPDRIKVVSDGEQITYEYRQPSGGMQIFRADQMLHIKAFTYDGITGRSPLEIARDVYGQTIATDEFGSSAFVNGAMPAGVLEYEKTFDDEDAKQALDRLRDQFSEHYSGSSNSRKPLILEDGVTWKQTSMTLQDAQFIKQRQFQLSEIARIYGVPPHLIADLSKSSFNNIEQQSLEFVQQSLMPWLVKIESQMKSALLGVEDSRFFKFNVDALLRGTTRERMEAHGIAINWGILTRNEARAIEDRNPLPGLDDPLTPLNMTEEGSATDSADDARALVPALQKIFKNASNEQQAYDFGLPVVLAYAKLRGRAADKEVKEVFKGFSIGGGEKDFNSLFDALDQLWKKK